MVDNGTGCYGSIRRSYLLSALAPGRGFYIVGDLDPQAFDETDEANETILPARRSHPETNQCSHPLKIKKWDAIMLPLILNAIYRHFLQAALSGISSQGARL